MPTRFRLSSSNGAGIKPNAGSTWNFNTPPPFTRRRLYYPRRDNLAFRTDAYAETVSTRGDRSMAQFISDPLAAGNVFALTDTVKGQIRMFESDAAADLRTQIQIRVVSEDGLTQRAVIYAPEEASTTVGAEELATVTLTNRKLPFTGHPTNLTSAYTTVAGDRLVIEIGYRYHNTVTTTYEATVETGDLSTVADLPEDETQTTQGTPWIEFSNDLVFAPFPDFLIDHNPHEWPDDVEAFSLANQYAKITTHKRKGTHSGSYKVRPGDTFAGGERCEGRAFDSDEQTLEGQTHYYGGSVNLRSPWSNPTNWGMFLQWHGDANFIQPLISLEVLEANPGGAGLCAVFHTGLESAGPAWEYDRRHPISRAVPVDFFFDWKLAVKWERTAIGSLKWEIRFPGEPWQTVLDLTNIPTLPHKDIGGVDTTPETYLKGGFYRSNESFTSLLFLDEYLRDPVESTVTNHLPEQILRSANPTRNAGSLTSQPLEETIAGVPTTPITLAAGLTMTPTLARVKSAPRAISAGLTLDPAIVRKQPRAIDASLLIQPTMARKEFEALDFPMPLNPVMAEVVKKAVAFSTEMPLSAVMAHVPKKAMDAGLPLSLELRQKGFESFEASLPLSAALETTLTAYKALDAALVLTSAVSLEKRAGRSLDAMVTLTPEMMNVGVRPHLLDTGLAMTAEIERKMFEAFDLGLPLTVAMANPKSASISIPSSLLLTPEVSALARTARSISATLVLSPEIADVAIHPRAIDAALSLSPALNRKLFSAMNFNMPLSVSLVAAGLYKQQMNASLPLTSQIALLKTTDMALGAILSLSSSLARVHLVYRALSASMGLTASLTRKVGLEVDPILLLTPVLTHQWKPAFLQISLDANLILQPDLAFRSGPVPISLSADLALIATLFGAKLRTPDQDPFLIGAGISQPRVREAAVDGGVILLSVDEPSEADLTGGGI